MESRAVPGVEVEQTKRYVAGALAELLSGRRIGFEADKISYAQWDEIRGGGADLVPTYGLVGALRAVKDAAELDAILRAYRSDARQGTIMNRIARGYTEAELAAASAFFCTP